ncbi:MULTISPECIES: hypothetical protein [Bacillaceae]|uniref:Uncharacterized protein n=1 Tax=Ectobacillus funiculus TaxID=137993 RepID=A0ABV5WA28_9BACI|nr:hypothetical protein [Ectobacillus funiculus]
MHWFRLVPVIFFSLSALSLFTFQFGEIIHSIQELIGFYKQQQ